MSHVYIYTLSDSLTNEIRYVGKTKNLIQRKYNHLNKSRDKNTHKRNWINLLIKEGRKPIMEVLDIVDDLEWKYWEKYWIQQIKAWGFRLVNCTSGGDGLSFANKTSFKKGSIPWNKGNKKPKILKPPVGKSENCVKNYFKVGHTSWNKGNIGIKLKPDKNVYQYSALTGCFLNKWNTAKHASISLNINAQAIGQCARGVLKTSGGFIWSYNYTENKKPILYTGKTNNKIKLKLQ